MSAAAARHEANLEALKVLWTDDALRGICRQEMQNYEDALGEDLRGRCDFEEMLDLLGAPLAGKRRAEELGSSPSSKRKKLPEVARAKSFINFMKRTRAGTLVACREPRDDTCYASLDEPCTRTYSDTHYDQQFVSLFLERYLRIHQDQEVLMIVLGNAMERLVAALGNLPRLTIISLDDCNKPAQACTGSGNRPTLVVLLGKGRGALAGDVLAPIIESGTVAFWNVDVDAHASTMVVERLVCAKDAHEYHLLHLFTNHNMIGTAIL